MLVKKIIALLTVFIMSSCADYRYQDLDNPFSQYGIKSLTVPMFYNQTSFANVSAPFTREVFRMLSGFKGLRLESGKSNTDATLIGIVTSADSLKIARRSTNSRGVKSILGENSLPDRNDFFVPSVNSLQMSLQIIVMKHPTDEEIKFLKSGLGNGTMISSKIIFTETVPLNSTFTREIFSNEGMQVIGTQNRGAQKITVQSMAKNAATTFRDMILYAF
jgi:hypothetical protein